MSDKNAIKVHLNGKVLSTEHFEILGDGSGQAIIAFDPAIQIKNGDSVTVEYEGTTVTGGPVGSWTHRVNGLSGIGTSSVSWGSTSAGTYISPSPRYKYGDVVRQKDAPKQREMVVSNEGDGIITTIVLDDTDFYQWSVASRHVDSMVSVEEDE